MGLEVPRQGSFAQVSWEHMDCAKRTGFSIHAKDRASTPLPVVWVGDDYCSIRRTDQVALPNRFIAEMMHDGELIALAIDSVKNAMEEIGRWPTVAFAVTPTARCPIGAPARSQAVEEAVLPFHHPG